LAVCRALAQRFPGARLALLDKEPTLGAPGAMRARIRVRDPAADGDGVCVRVWVCAWSWSSGTPVVAQQRRDTCGHLLSTGLDASQAVRARRQAHV